MIATQSYRKPSILLFHVLLFVSSHTDCKREMKGKSIKVTIVQSEEVGEYLPLCFFCFHRLRRKKKNRLSSLSTSEPVAVGLLNYAFLLKTNTPYTLSACFMNSDPFFEELRQTYTCCNALSEAACEGRNLVFGF